MTNSNKGTGTYVPSVNMLDTDVIWRKTTKNSRIEFASAMGIDKIKIRFQQLKELNGQFRQTGLVEIYMDLRDIHSIIRKVEHGFKLKEGENVLYKSPNMGTPAAALEKRGIGRNGYAEFRQMLIQKGNKIPWILTGMSCDGVQNDKGLINPHKGQDGKYTGEKKISVGLTSDELVDLAYTLKEGINGFRTAQWVLAGFYHYFEYSDDNAEATPAPVAQAPAAAKHAEEPVGEEVDVEVDDYDAPAAEPAPQQSASTGTYSNGTWDIDPDDLPF